MKKSLAIFFLAIPFISFSQVESCPNKSLNFLINKYPRRDTLGDLVLTSNSYTFCRNLSNIFFLNKKYKEINLWLDGGDICTYNDTTLIVNPKSTTCKFKYLYKGDTLTKKRTVNLWERAQIIVQFDNRIQVKEKNLINYKHIDTLSFDIELEEFDDFYPREDFNFTISSGHISLSRNNKLIKDKVYKNDRSFYIGNILKKGKPGDKITIYFYPQWIRNGKPEYMNCGGFITYTLGRAE